MEYPLKKRTIVARDRSIPTDHVGEHDILRTDPKRSSDRPVKARKIENDAHENLVFLILSNIAGGAVLFY
jgi:hypothetical protein